MVRRDITKCQIAGVIRILTLACLTISSINGVSTNGGTSQRSSNNDQSTSMYGSVSVTHNISQGSGSTISSNSNSTRLPSSVITMNSSTDNKIFSTASPTPSKKFSSSLESTRTLNNHLATTMMVSKRTSREHTTFTISPTITDIRSSSYTNGTSTSFRIFSTNITISSTYSNETSTPISELSTNKTAFDKPSLLTTSFVTKTQSGNLAAPMMFNTSSGELTGRTISPTTTTGIISSSYSNGALTLMSKFSSNQIASTFSISPTTSGTLSHSTSTINRTLSSNLAATITVPSRTSSERMTITGTISSRYSNETSTPISELSTNKTVSDKSSIAPTTSAGISRSSSTFNKTRNGDLATMNVSNTSLREIIPLTISSTITGIISSSCSNETSTSELYMSTNKTVFDKFSISHTTYCSISRSSLAFTRTPSSTLAATMKVSNASLREITPFTISSTITSTLSSGFLNGTLTLIRNLSSSKAAINTSSISPRWTGSISPTSSLVTGIPINILTGTVTVSNTSFQELTRFTILPTITGMRSSSDSNGISTLDSTFTTNNTTVPSTPSVSPTTSDFLLRSSSKFTRTPNSNLAATMNVSNTSLLGITSSSYSNGTSTLISKFSKNKTVTSSIQISETGITGSFSKFTGTPSNILVGTMKLPNSTSRELTTFAILPAISSIPLSSYSNGTSKLIRTMSTNNTLFDQSSISVTPTINISKTTTVPYTTTTRLNTFSISSATTGTESSSYSKLTSMATSNISIAATGYNTHLTLSITSLSTSASTFFNNENFTAVPTSNKSMTIIVPYATTSTRTRSNTSSISSTTNWPTTVTVHHKTSREINALFTSRTIPHVYSNFTTTPTISNLTRIMTFFSTNLDSRTITRTILPTLPYTLLTSHSMTVHITPSFSNFTSTSTRKLTTITKESDTNLTTTNNRSFTMTVPNIISTYTLPTTTPTASSGFYSNFTSSPINNMSTTILGPNTTMILSPMTLVLDTSLPTTVTSSLISPSYSNLAQKPTSNTTTTMTVFSASLTSPTMTSIISPSYYNLNFTASMTIKRLTAIISSTMTSSSYPNFTSTQTSNMSTTTTSGNTSLRMPNSSVISTTKNNIISPSYSNFNATPVRNMSTAIKVTNSTMKEYNTIIMRVSNTTVRSAAMTGNLSPSNSKLTVTPTSDLTSTKVSNAPSTLFTGIVLPSYSYLNITVSTTRNSSTTMVISHESFASASKTGIKLSRYSNFTVTPRSNLLKTMAASNTSTISLAMTVIVPSSRPTIIVTPTSDKSATLTILNTTLTSSPFVVSPGNANSTATAIINMTTTSVSSPMTPTLSPSSSNVTATPTSNLSMTLNLIRNTTIGMHNTSLLVTAIISPSYSNITGTPTNHFVATMAPHNTITASRNSTFSFRNMTKSLSLSHLNISVTATLPNMSYSNTKVTRAKLSIFLNTSMQSPGWTKSVTSLTSPETTVTPGSFATNITSPEKTMVKASVTMTATIMSSGVSNIVELSTSLAPTTKQLVGHNVSSTKPSSTVTESSLVTVNASSSHVKTQRSSSIILIVTSNGILVSNVSSTKLQPSSTVLQSHLVATSRNGNNISTQTSSSMFSVSSNETEIISSLNISPPSTIPVSHVITAIEQASSTILTSTSSNMIYSRKILPSSTVPQSPMVTSNRSSRHAFSPKQTVTLKGDLVFNTTSFTKLFTSIPLSTSRLSSLIYTAERSLLSNTMASTELLIPSTVSHSTRISASKSQASTSRLSSSIFTSKGSLASNIISSTELSTYSTSPDTTRISSRTKQVSTSRLSSLIFTPGGPLMSNIISSTELLTYSTSSHTTRISSRTKQVSTSWLSSLIFTPGGPLMSNMISSTELLTRSTSSRTMIISSSPSEVSTSRLISALTKTTTKATILFKIPSSSHYIVSTASVSGSDITSCRSCTDTLYTSTVASVPLSSSSVVTTTDVSENFKVQVTLLISLNVDVLNNTFIEKLKGNLESLFDIGTAKISSSRKRRAIKEKMIHIDPSGDPQQLIKKELHVSMEIVNDRLKRQITNRTSVEILNITRTPGSENVQVIFYVSSGKSLVPAKQVVMTMNAPTKAEKVAALGYQVSEDFSAVILQEETSKKKNDETLLIVLAVCLPVAFVFAACLFIKCKKKQKSSRIMKLNKVSIEQPTPREKASVTENGIEERYTRMATLPRKDYPDVIVQTPARRKQRTKKAKLPLVLNSENENPPTVTPSPAAAFENITRMSFDGPSNVTIDDIPLRLRPAVRQDTEPMSKDILEDSGIPRSWIDNKQRVEMHSKDSYRKGNGKEVASNGDTPRDMEEIDDADSDDTMQIKANIEKWRNKMRQREKRKQRNVERKHAEQDKLIALEQKKLSRREWLMAQPEIQAILDGEDLPTSSSLRKKKYRRERWRESRKHLDSESDEEVMVVPVKRHHRRRWPHRTTRQVGPSEHDGVRLIAVRPKKPRVYAFEGPAAEQEFEPKYIPAEVSSVPPPVVAEAMQLREEYNHSPDSVYDEEFFDPFVPEYESRYYAPPGTEYVMRQAPVTLEQQLPLRMQETSFTGTPQRAPRVLRHIDTRHGAMFYEQQPPRPSSLYSRARRAPTAAQNDITREEINDGHSSRTPTSENTTPRGVTTDNSHSPKSGKTKLASNQNETLPTSSLETKTDAEFRNYNISESEARKLVSRVLDRAAKNEGDRD